jgi:type VI protein secretion system component VasK
MEFLSPVHLTLIVLMAIVLFWPFGRILQRLGFNPLWCLVMFIPLVGTIALWLFAYSRWPALENAGSRDQG